MKKIGKLTTEHWTRISKNLSCTSTARVHGENTVTFIKHLRQQRPGKRLVLIWDGASYHKSEEMKALLANVNAGQDAEKWQLRCILFAPNAPEQNPVEDVWLQAKNFIRKYWLLCQSFAVVKWLFKFFTHHQRFEFPKLEQYTKCSSTI
ncbi:MAG: hypothetical protein F6K28_57720 [Microcoleus sp. SIO2G3]|nr:hypothetical protein [Microcoleus sp. SIO2G3]